MIIAVHRTFVNNLKTSSTLLFFEHFEHFQHFGRFEHFEVFENFEQFEHFEHFQYFERLNALKTLRIYDVLHFTQTLLSFWEIHTWKVRGVSHHDVLKQISQFKIYIHGQLNFEEFFIPSRLDIFLISPEKTVNLQTNFIV